MGSREEFDLTEGIVGVKESDPESAKYWQSFGAAICVIKHGKEGSTAYTNDGKFYSIKPFLLLNSKALAAVTDTAHRSFTVFLKAKKLLNALNSALLQLQSLFLLTPVLMLCQAPLRWKHSSRKARKNTAKW